MISPVNVVSREFKANPYPFYAQLRVEAPVYPLTIPVRGKAWYVTRYEDVLALVKDERFVKDTRNVSASEQTALPNWMPPFLRPIAQNMLSLDGEDHNRLRGLVHKALHAAPDRRDAWLDRSAVQSTSRRGGGRKAGWT